MKSELNKSDTNVEQDTASQEPPLFQVCLHNDDFTPMEFVVAILEKFFFMDRASATSIMYEAHKTGRAVCGVFSKDIAEAKVVQVTEHAETNEYPLLCSMEVS